MFRLAEQCPGVCSVGYDDVRNAVIITWAKNDNDAFQPMLETQLRLVQEHAAAVVIVDTSQVTGTVDSVNQAWLTDDFFPRMSRTGLRRMITVMPRSATAVLVNRRSFRGHDLPFEVVETQSLDEALALASSPV